jgi:hypothetical protein
MSYLNVTGYCKKYNFRQLWSVDVSCCQDNFRRLTIVYEVIAYLMLAK